MFVFVCFCFVNEITKIDLKYEGENMLSNEK